MMVREWVAAHPGYFYFWGSLLLIFLACYVGAGFFIHWQVGRVIERLPK